jgi:hypothetical protein
MKQLLFLIPIKGKTADAIKAEVRQILMRKQLLAGKILTIPPKLSDMANT